MTIENLTREDRLNIYRAVERTRIFEIFRQNGTFASFIASFEDIHERPSSDYRFRTFYEDIVQHCQNNDDYSSDEVLLSKINILGDSFKKFLISCLDSNWYGTELPLLKKVKEVLEQRLSSFNLIIESERLPSGIVVWNIKEGDNRYILADVKPNDIPIFLDSNPDYPTNKIGNHRKPDKFPALVLAFDKYWDDFSVHIQFDVFFHLNDKITHYIGKTRIMAEDKILTDNVVDKLKITDFLKEKVFLALPDGFCSLGKNENYYRSLIISLQSEEKTRSLLWALKDVGLFSTLQEKFENQKLWSCMTFEKTSQHMLRFAHKALAGQKYGNDYGFTYMFRPPYTYKDTETPGSAEPRIEIKFNFNQERIWPSRLYALIGKNGCGKTRLLSSIPRSLSWRTPDDFNGAIPVFGKIIAVSNSHYDNFDIPKTRADFNYVYCGLSEIKEGARQSLGLDQIIDIIFRNCAKANKQLRELLKKGMSQIADKNLVTGIFNSIENEDDDSDIKTHMRTLSSGELGMLYLYSSILINIRYDSLILFDELENHLHPNSIVQMITLLYEILENYESYAILATHSPIVIQAVRGENVFVMTREEDYCSVRKIDRESLGANLSDLTDNVFGNIGLPRYYKTLIDKLLSFCNPDEVERLLKNDQNNRPLSLPMQLYIDAKKLGLKNIQHK